ncbi:MAG: hypothetical protein RugAbin2_01429 [Rugosibacter sp.]|nr:hypothetical protein [Rugosibacter sp.]
MKLKFKLMAAAVALAASAGANAAIVDSSAGNGELFFTIYDAGADLSSKADDRAYVLDLGSLLNGGTMNDWVSATTTAPLPALNANKQGFGTIFSISADANMQSFLAASTDTSRLLWNIAAGDANGTDRVLTTATSISLAETPVYTQFRSNFASKIDGYVGPYVNDAGIPESGSILLNGAGAGLAAWSNNFGGGSVFSNAAGLGDSLGFFVLSERVASGSTAIKADVRQFMADANTAMQWTLGNDGNLSYGAVAVAAIPEPSEYALMLAGLGMLGFMARRRLNNRA